MTEQRSGRRPYRELWTTLQKEPIRSITVDIFDTLVLRDFTSEEERFFEIARRWLPVVRDAISQEVTDWEIYSFRNYVRSLEQRAFAWSRATGIASSEHPEFEIRLADWVAGIVRQLAEKYSVRLTGDQSHDLTHRLIELELAYEASVLKPNRLLLRLLTGFQERQPVKVYLVSDMYLSAAQLKDLLARVGVPSFDGIVSSSDLGVSKKSGRLFDLLETDEHFPGFTNPGNLHVGDRRQNDFLAPLSRGSRAILLRTNHHELQRVGYRVSKRVTQAKFAAYRRQQASAWVSRSLAEGSVAALGALFAPSALHYIRTFVSRAKADLSVPFVAVSSEGRFFEKAVRATCSGTLDNLHFLPNINRAALLHSIELAARQRGLSPKVAKAPFLQDVRGQLTEDAVSEAEVANEIAWPFETFAGRNKQHVVLLDVGWMGTIQVMLRELASIDERSVEVSGIYLGRFARASRFGFWTGVREGVVFDDVTSRAERPYFVPELWEYILGNKAKYDELGPHEELQRGVYWAFADWQKKVHLAPTDFVQATNPYLKGTLWSPPKQAREILGSILWDVNTADGVEYRPLIPPHRPSIFAKNLSLFLRPRTSYREFVTPEPHVWLAGYARALKVGWFMNLSLWVARRLGHLDARDF
jgi:FMN phosphatase YigB (HAD superfamily)